jgi:hypothetical protein
MISAWGRARQTVEPRDHQQVAGIQPLEKLAQLGPIGLRTRHLLAVDLNTPGSV